MTHKKTASQRKATKETQKKVASVFFSAIMAFSMMCPSGVTQAFADELNKASADDATSQSDTTTASDTTSDATSDELSTQDDDATATDDVTSTSTSDEVTTQDDDATTAEKDSASTTDAAATTDSAATTTDSAADAATTYTVTLTAADGATFDTTPVDGVTFGSDATTATITVSEGKTIGDVLTADTMPKLVCPDGMSLASWTYETADGTQEVTADQLLTFKVSKNVILTTKLAATDDELSTMSDKVIYWNPTETALRNPEDSSIICPAGDDTNSGSSADYPVLTYDRVKQIFESSTGYTVYVMTTAVLGTEKADSSGYIVPLNFDIEGMSADGSTDYNVTFTTWDQNAEELFLVPSYSPADSSTTPATPETQAGSLTVAHVKLSPEQSSMNSIRVISGNSADGANAKGGQLTIGAGFTTTSPIQYELDEYGRSLETTGADNAVIYNPLILNASSSDVPQSYTVYYSGVNSNLYYQYANVVKAGANGPSDLAASASTYFTLSSRNADANWSYVYDGQGLHPTDQTAWTKSTLELYCQYKYTGVYVNPTVTTSSFGGTCEYPVKTMEEAIDIVENGVWEDGVDRNIYICSTVSVATDTTWDLTADRTAYNTKVYACPSPIENHTHTVVSTMFDVQAGATLTLKGVDIIHNIASQTVNKVTTDITHTLIQIDAGGAVDATDTNLIGGTGAVIAGWGVKMAGSDTATTSFTMSGDSSITNNNRGIEAIGATDKTKTLVTLNGGTVKGNSFVTKSNKVGYAGGAGIYASAATITLAGASVDGNTTAGNSWYSNGSHYVSASGAGIHAESTDITMSAGSVSSNKISSYGSYYSCGGSGGGIYQNGGTLTLSGGTISGNTIPNDQYDNGGNGAGIAHYGTGTVTMSAGTISTNTGAYNGGGLYIDSSVNTLDMTGGTFQENSAAYGGGIYAGSSTTVNVSNATFTANTANGWQGGAINASQGSTKTTISNSTFTKNTAKGNSAGAVFLQSSTAAYPTSITDSTFDGNDCGSGYYGNAVYASGTKFTMTGCTIKNNGPDGRTGVYAGTDTNTITDCGFADNTASYYGGGLYTSGTSTVTGCTFTGNSCTGSGGGAAYAGATTTFDGCTFTGNSSSGNGGAIFAAGNSVKIVDCDIEDNSATSYGGGVAVNSGTTYLYQSTAGSTILKANSAGSYGGGLAVLASGTAHIEGATLDENTATSGGATLYNSGMLWMVGGTYKHAADTDNAVYNDVSYSNLSNKLYLDPTAVTFEHDFFYLNTAPSKIWQLKDAGSTTFPISVNTENFKTGSVVVTPSGSVSRYDHTNTPTTYSQTDVSTYADTFKGGTLPTGASILGYKTDLILNGQGVYIDGINGDDTNSGADANHPVKTWDQAVTNLKACIATANAASTTFEPYIYDLGTVTVSTDTKWSLDYATDATLVQTARAYDDTWYPQVMRFASYYGTLVDTTAGTLTLDHVTINGHAEGCSPTNNTTTEAGGGVDPLVQVRAGATVNMVTGSKLVDNYQYGALVTGGTLNMSGTSYIGNNRNDGINAVAAATISMTDTAEINMGASYATNTSDVPDRAGVDLTGTDAARSTLTMKGTSHIEAQGVRGVQANNYSEVTIGESTDAQDAFAYIDTQSGTGIFAASNTNVTLNGYSQIRYSGEADDVDARDGIGYFSGSSVNDAAAAPNFTMNDYSQLTNLSSGVATYRETLASMSRYSTSRYLNATFNDNASINNVNQGIYLGGDTYNPTFTFNDDAAITKSHGWGVYGSSVNTVTIIMNDQASFTKCVSGGISGNESDNWKITMNDDTTISDVGDFTSTEDVSVSGYGIQAGAYCDKWSIELNDNASINPLGSRDMSTVSGVGDLVPIYLTRYYWDSCGSHTVTMNDASKLTGCNNYAYWDEGTGSVLTMNGTSSIDGGTANKLLSQQALVYVYNGYQSQPQATQINLNDSAVIKNAHYGDGSTANPESTYYGRGIYVGGTYGGSCAVTMTGSSAVKDNYGTGIYLYTDNNTTGNTISLALSGAASITGNGGRGIYLKSYTSGVSSTGTNVSATLGAGTTVSGNAASYADTDLLGKQVYNNGDLTLDAAATVGGEIYLPIVGRIITLTDTTGVGASGITKDRFTVGYTVNFVDERVVGPSATVSDATAYLAGFKESANVDPQYQMIAGTGTNANYIIVGGAKDVYLAGDSNSYNSGSGAFGDDANTGKSPASPVRTFARAKQILADLPAGANIIICNHYVDPTTATTTLTADGTDLDWSFDADGTFTNTAGETWTPKIVPYQSGTTVLNTPMVMTTGSGKELKLNGLTFQLNTTDTFTDSDNGSSTPCYSYPAIMTEAGNATIDVAGCAFVNGVDAAVQVSTSNSAITVDDCDFSDFATTYTYFYSWGSDNSETGTQTVPSRFLYCGSGELDVKNCDFSNQKIMASGFHYIYSNDKLSVSDCAFDGNEFTPAWDYYTWNGGTRCGCWNNSAGGLLYSSGKTSLSNCSFDGNSWDYTFPVDVEATYTYCDGLMSGAAVYLGGTSTIDACTVDGNSFVSPGNGPEDAEGNISSRGDMRYRGTMYLAGDTTMTNSSVSNNTVAGGAYVQGVGIYAEDGTQMLTDCTIDSNKVVSTTATQTGWPDEEDYTMGGGIYAYRNANLTFLSGSISNNVSKKGPGIYLEGDRTTTGGATVQLGGGTVANNTCYDSTDTTFAHAGIFDDGVFVLKGGRASISDNIYLDSVNHPITLAGAIYQRGRIYNVDCNTTDTDPNLRFYGRGSVVVQPDGDVLNNVTGYIRYFNVDAVGFVLAKQQPNLVLKSYVFLDSVNGSDANDGSNPDNAFKSFAGAVAALTATGDDIRNIIFYVSGPMNVTSDETWSLDASRAETDDGSTGDLTSEVTRYTGFSLSGGHTWPAYTGNMFDVSNGATLTFDNITVNGRRDYDSLVSDSMVKVEEGATLTLNANSTLIYNDNTDTAVGSGKGGAVYNSGTVNVNDTATISTTTANDGDSIYSAVNADGTPGAINMAGTSTVDSSIYLEGTGTSRTDQGDNAVVDVATSYAPSKNTNLSIVLQNAYDGRAVVNYPTSYTPTTDDAKQYQLESSVASLYRLTNRSGETNVLELQLKGAIYIDGQNGSDAEGRGFTPDTAVKTLKRAYELMKANEESDPKGYGGGVLYVVDTVDVSSGVQLVNTPGSATSQDRSQYIDTTTPANNVETAGTVYIRRYSQPTAHASLSGYDHTSNTNALFNVKDGGTLTMSDFGVAGHSEEIVSSDTRYAAPGVEATSALVTVQGGGTLSTNWCEFTDNDNTSADGQGGAIYVTNDLLNGNGSVTLTNATISNTEAAKGSAIYNNGELCFDSNMDISGATYLAGTGSEGAPASSHYITIKTNGTVNASGKYEVQVEDPYRTREIVDYPSTATAAERASYSFEANVTDYYVLRNRTADDSILELQFKTAIYIDGVKGSDSNDGLTADTSVKTLEQAYKLLEKTEGSYLYVVDTVTTTADTTLTPTSYTSGSTTVNLTVNPVEVFRYSKPTTTVTGFTHESNKNTLFNVAGGTLTTSDLTIDGHSGAISNPLIGNPVYPASLVADGVEATSALVSTTSAGTLQLDSGTVLQNNKNVSVASDANANQGGAIYNQGTTYLNQATVTNMTAAKGAAAFQDGSQLVIESMAADALGTQGIYLAATNAGTDTNPNWTNRYITVNGDELPDGVTINLEMDHAVRARNVVNYGDGSYSGDLADQAAHFTLGNTVNDKLSLVVSDASSEANTLELQDYTDLTIAKTWNIPAGWTAAKPTLTFTLSNNDANGDDVSTTVVVDNTTGTPTCDHGTVIVNGDGSWTITVTKMAGYEDEGTSDDQITYALDETLIGGVVPLKSDYHPTVSDPDVASFTVYNPVQRSITYHADDVDSGTVPDEQWVDWNSDVTVASNTGNLVRAGYTFAGWNTAADGSGTHYDEGGTMKAVQDDVDLYAMWVKDGTKTSAEHVADNTLRPGEQLDYTINVGTSEACTVTDVVPANVTYVDGSASDSGVYDAATRTITWTFSAGACVDKTLTFSATIAEDAAWNDTVTNTAGVNIGKNTYKTNPDTNKVGETYKVTYVANGATSGSVPVDGTHWAPGETATVLGNTGALKQDGYYFAGWNTKADGSGTHYDAADTIAIAHEAVTLYAQWVHAEKTVAKSDSEEPLIAGQKLTYTIDASAPEGGDLTVTDTIPEGTTYVAGSATESGVYDETAGTITWTFLGVAAGTAKTLTFQVTVDDDAKYGDTISNTAKVAIGDNTYNTNEATITVEKRPDATNWVKKCLQDEAKAGSTLTYEITVSNDTDTYTSTSTLVRDYIPTYTTYVSSTQKGVYDSVNNCVSWLVPGLEPGEEYTVTLVVKVDATLPDGASIENIAMAGPSGLPDNATKDQIKNAPDPEGTTNKVDTAQPTVEPVVTPTSTTTPTSTATPASTKAIPKTADALAGVSAAVVVCLVAAAAALIFARRERRRG